MQIVTSWMRRGIEQGLEQGLERGLEQGLEQGLTQGRVEGQRTEALSLILGQLARQVGSLPNETEQRVAQLSLTQLETLSLDLLGFTGLTDLQDWLAQNQ
jgi:flagellar biosynthesis/type III secretory pathway protein FliH